MKNKSKEEVLDVLELQKTALELVGLLLVAPLIMVFGGYVTQYLWNGLISPTFGIKALTLAQATGLDLTVSFIVAPKSSNSEEGAFAKLARIILSNLLFMLVGWIIMKFI